MKQYITFHGAPSRNNLGDPPKFDSFIVARGTFEYTPQQAPPPSKPRQLSQLPHSSQFSQLSQSTPKRSSKNPASNASASQSMWRDAYGDGGSQLDPELLAWVQARESSLVLAGERLSKVYDGVSFKDEEVEDDYDRSIKEVTDEDVNDAIADTEMYDWSESFHNRLDSDLASDFSLGIGQKSESQAESQNTFAQHSSLYSSFNETGSFDTDGDSRDSTVLHMPTFRIPVALLSSLKTLLDPAQRSSAAIFRNSDDDNSVKVSLVVGILDVDGPDTIRIKRGKDAGKEVSLLKLIMGESAGTITKLTVWRELADEWGGMIRKGDVVHLQDVLFAKQPSGPGFGGVGGVGGAGGIGGVTGTGTGTFTASENLKSKATVCYRTIPWNQDDRRLRPDLRLAMIDPGVAKVADVVEWLERICGLPKST